MGNWQRLHVDQNCQRMRAAVTQWSAKKFQRKLQTNTVKCLFKETFIMD